MSIVEKKEKSEIIEEAIEKLFEEKINKYSTTAVSFLKETYPELFS